MVNMTAKRKAGSRKASSMPNPPALLVSRSQYRVPTRMAAATCQVMAYAGIHPLVTGST